MPEPGTLAHVYNPSTQEDQAGGLRVQDLLVSWHTHKERWFSYSEINVIPDILTENNNHIIFLLKNENITCP